MNINQQHMLQDTLDNIGAFVFIKDVQGRYLYANKMVCALFGRELEDIIGRDDSAFFSLAQSNELCCNDQEVLTTGITLECEECNVIASTGEARYYLSVKRPLRDEQGTIIGIQGVSYDITERRKLEVCLKEQQALLSAVLDHVDACVYMKDVNGKYLYANPATLALYGLTAAQVVGYADADILPADIAASFSCNDQQVLSRHTKLSVQESIKDGSGQQQHYMSTKVPLLDAAGKAYGMVGFSFNITELHNLKLRLEKLSQIDDLTGVANRRHFLTLAERDLHHARRYKQALTLIVFDLDHFKKINDRYGHAAGDRVLQVVAQACNAALRATDTLGRIGGEEFAISLPNTSLDDGCALAERIRLAVSALQVALAGRLYVQVTLSLGVVQWQPGIQNLETLLAAADTLLYQAKAQGRNQYCA